HHHDFSLRDICCFPTQRSSDLLKMLSVDPGHIGCPGERVIDWTCRKDLTGPAIDHLFIEGGSDALSYRAVHLPIDDRRVDNAAADRKITRLNSSHLGISYAVFC